MKNKPAFPVIQQYAASEFGLTKLEYFAGLAMQGILSSPTSWRNNSEDSNEVFAAKRSIAFAKELIKQLENDI